MKYLLLVALLLGTIYTIPDKLVNRIVVKIYLSTDIGRETIRNQSHADCYFTGQYLQLNKGITVDMFDLEHDHCWEAADRTLKQMQNGQFSIAF